MIDLLDWPMKFLTPQEQRVLIAVLVLLATGLVVKAWREANPSADGDVSVTENDV